jgi:hypothetical protein
MNNHQFNVICPEYQTSGALKIKYFVYDRRHWNRALECFSSFVKQFCKANAIEFNLECRFTARHIASYQLSVSKVAVWYDVVPLQDFIFKLLSLL